MIIKIEKNGKTNCFTGDEIESLEMEDSILADYCWRGNDVYLSLYSEEIPSDAVGIKHKDGSIELI